MKRRILKALTLVGCFSTGIIYGSIGVIAILSFLKLKNGGADESSFFVLLNRILFGRIINWVIIVGALCFIVWRLYESFADPHRLGRSTKAILLRAGGAFSSVADAFIALSALQALYSPAKAPVSGEPTLQRNLAAAMLETGWGRFALGAAAVVLLLTAIVLVFYGLSKRFTEAIDTHRFSKVQTRVLHGLAYLGYLARGIIVGVTGFFYLEAVLMHNSRSIVNTDKAFDFIGDNIGAAAFLMVALGTVCYGFYLFVLGLHYDVAAGKSTTRKSG